LNFKQAWYVIAEKYRKMKMASNRNKDPQNNFLDKLRSLLGFQERQKNTLPPKAHFSIWYFLIDIFLFTYLLQYFLSAKGETVPCSQFKQYITPQHD